MNGGEKSQDDTGMSFMSQALDWCYQTGLLKKSPIWREHSVLLTSTKTGVTYFVVPPPRTLNLKENQSLFQRGLSWIFSNK